MMRRLALILFLAVIILFPYIFQVNAQSNLHNDVKVLKKYREMLLNKQSSDGSWGDKMYLTTLSIFFLKEMGMDVESEQLAAAIDWILSTQGSDGSFGDGWIRDTAWALVALSEVGMVDTVQFRRGERFFITRVRYDPYPPSLAAAAWALSRKEGRESLVQQYLQQVMDAQAIDGSWGDVWETALTIIALTQCGLDKENEKVARALEYMRTKQVEEGYIENRWYCRNSLALLAFILSKKPRNSTTIVKLLNFIKGGEDAGWYDIESAVVTAGALYIFYRDVIEQKVIDALGEVEQALPELWEKCEEVYDFTGIHFYENLTNMLNTTRRLLENRSLIDAVDLLESCESLSGCIRRAYDTIGLIKEGNESIWDAPESNLKDKAKNELNIAIQDLIAGCQFALEGNFTGALELLSSAERSANVALQTAKAAKRKITIGVYIPLIILGMFLTLLRGAVHLRKKGSR